jgi:hypothetical protein
MIKDMTTRTWTPEDVETVAAVKLRAHLEGSPFPDLRVVKRLQRKGETLTRKSLGIVGDPSWRT